MRTAGGSSARSAEAKRRARRVPEDQRKRGVQSCDLCRKTRFYGNVEDLSDRFRCLEAIVKEAFPDEAIDSVADLMRLGQSRGYRMPDLSQNAETPVKTDDALRIARPSEPPNEEATSASPATNHLAHPSLKPTDPATHQDTPSSAGGTVSLVSDASGKEHYIGPSGGLQFLGQLRRLLISREQRPDAQYLLPPSVVSKFTEDDGAQALEAEESREGGPESRNNDDVSITATRDHRSPGSVASLESDSTRKSSAGIEEHWRRLPSQDLLDKLLQSFFQNVHDDFVLFHRGTFEGDYEAQTRMLRRRGNQPQQDGEPDLGLLACVYMILVFGSMSDPTIGGNSLDHNALRRHCVSSARSLLPHLISKCTLYNLRALLLLGLFLHNNNERNATWNLVGTATRLAFALGLHRRDTESAFNPIEREIRKRIFCTLYGFEQFLATSLGRPSGINDIDVEVIPPRAGMLDGNGGGSDAALVSFTLRLYRILGTSRASQGTESSANAIVEPRALNPEATLLDLEQWRADLSKQQWLNIPPIKTGERLIDDVVPSAMGFDDLKSLLRWQSRGSLRAALMLHLQYHYIALFITRPFLLQELSVNGQTPDKGRSDSTSRQISLAGTCVHHASQMALICLLLDSFGLLNGVSGLDIFYVYWASMVLSLGMLRRHAPSDEARILVTLNNLVVQLRAVVAKAEKSGTMKRFTRLMGAFADYVNYRCMPPKASASDAQENGAARSESDRELGNLPLEPNHFAPGGLLGSEALDSFYWSNAMMPLGNTIEGGAGPDAFGGWTGDGIGNGADWMPLMGIGLDIPLDYGGSNARHV
ncbi:hypothetical protein Hte_007326 [Hypoxylon texense]